MFNHYPDDLDGGAMGGGAKAGPDPGSAANSQGLLGSGTREVHL